MEEFMKADRTGQLILREGVARDVAFRSDTITGDSMLSDDEVLTLVRTASQHILRLGGACGLGVQAHVISSELQKAAKSGKSKSLSAYEVCRKALELYQRESGCGKLFYIVNSRLRQVRSIQNPTRAEFVRAVTESCGDQADFIRLVWEGLNFEFPETPRRERVIYRGVELWEATLESYRDGVGKLFTWSMFASFTEKREEAEGYGRAWRGGIPVLFELRSVWCPRLRDRTCLLRPFAMLQVEAVVGNTVKLIEVDLVEGGHMPQLPGQRRGVGAKEGAHTELHKAAERGDVRAIATFSTRPEFINARDVSGWTPLAFAATCGKTEAVKALVSLGADVNLVDKNGATPVYLAARNGHLEVVKVLASLGAGVDVPTARGATPLLVAAGDGHLEMVKVLISLGADVNHRAKDGSTPVFVAAVDGHLEVLKTLASLGADLNIPRNDGVTPVWIAWARDHDEVAAVLVSLGADVNAGWTDRW
jgi:hypothetical protein